MSTIIYAIHYFGIRATQWPPTAFLIHTAKARPGCPLYRDDSTNLKAECRPHNTTWLGARIQTSPYCMGYQYNCFDNNGWNLSYTCSALDGSRHWPTNQDTLNHRSVTTWFQALLTYGAEVALLTINTVNTPADREKWGRRVGTKVRNHTVLSIDHSPSRGRFQMARVRRKLLMSEEPTSKIGLSSMLTNEESLQFQLFSEFPVRFGS